MKQMPILPLLHRSIDLKIFLIIFPAANVTKLADPILESNFKCHG